MVQSKAVRKEGISRRCVHKERKRSKNRKNNEMTQRTQRGCLSRDRRETETVHSQMPRGLLSAVSTMPNTLERSNERIGKCPLFSLKFKF